MKTELGEVFGKASARLSAESSCVICDPFLTNMDEALWYGWKLCHRKVVSS